MTNNELTGHGKYAVTFGAHVDDFLPVDVTLNSAGITGSIVVAKTWK